MKVRVEASSLKHTHWYGHVLRFVLGGTVTVAAGLVARWFGPAVGGILLAFPAIMPAALILLERSQNEQVPPPGCGARGRRAVVLDAVGAAMGSIGLIAFALVVWKTLVRMPTSLALIAGTAAWAVVAVLVWVARKRMARWLYGPNLQPRQPARRRVT
jgi:hypothetical protein